MNIRIGLYLNKAKQTSHTDKEQDQSQNRNKGKAKMNQ